MNLLEKTPRDLLRNQFLPKLPGGGTPLNRTDFPFDHSQFLPIGFGDWGRDQSAYGSVTESDGRYVCKYPQGSLRQRYSFDNFRFCSELIKAHEHVSPETTVVACGSDRGPLPLILQKKINGQPICEVPFGRLLNPLTLNSLLEIQKNALEVFQRTRCVDLCGTHFKPEIISKLVNIFPVFGDNIIVDPQGKCVLVDNLPKLRCRSGKDHFKSLIIKSGLRTGIIINRLVQSLCTLPQLSFFKKNRSLSQN